MLYRNDIFVTEVARPCLGRMIPSRPATHYAKARSSVKAKRYAYLRPTRYTYVKSCPS